MYLMKSKVHQDILEAYLEACQTSKIKPLTKMADG